MLEDGDGASGAMSAGSTEGPAPRPRDDKAAAQCASRRSARHGTLILVALGALVLASTLASLMLGRYPITPIEAVGMLANLALPIDSFWTSQQETLFFQVRLPRIALALMVGCSLATAGAAYQGTFQNPLVSPDILGASQGAAFGAAVAILLGLGSLGISLFAFACSIAAVLLVLAVGTRAKGNHLLIVVLAGVMVSSLFQAGVSFTKLIADPTDQLAAITYWLMGSLTGAKWSDMAFALPPIAIGLGHDRLGRPRHPPLRAHDRRLRLPQAAARQHAHGRQLPAHRRRRGAPRGQLRDTHRHPDRVRGSAVLPVPHHEEEAGAMSIDVEHLSFSYGSHHVLRDLSFRIPDNTLVNVLGPNGVGKSTLFRCILCLNNSWTGSIRVNGKDLRSISIRERASEVAYIPQSHSSTYTYDVLDVVLMSAGGGIGLFSTPKRMHVDRAWDALERVGIAHLGHRPYTQISGGERQLVLIARAIAQNARTIIMDEPTSALDYGNTVRVLSTVRQLAREGMSIVQSTHQPDQAFLYADQTLVINDGRVHAFGSPKDVITKELVSTIYDVDVEVNSLYGDKVRVCVPVREIER